MSVRVGMVGARGYVGEELLRMLTHHRDMEPVWLGASIALVAISALGVWVGRTVLQRIPAVWLHRLGGVIFLAFAMAAAWRALAV